MGLLDRWRMFALALQIGKGGRYVGRFKRGTSLLICTTHILLLFLSCGRFTRLLLSFDERIQKKTSTAGEPGGSRGREALTVYDTRENGRKKNTKLQMIRDRREQGDKNSEGN